jgi:starvation-inducible DNA-binding protein
MATRTKTTRVAINSERVDAELRPVLIDLIDLGLQGKQLHWNVRGPLFISIHRQLDDIVGDSRNWSDLVGERMTALGIAAPGQAKDVARETTLDDLRPGSISDADCVGVITERVGSVAATVRAAAENLGEIDIGSQDVLLEVLTGLEKHLWMLRVQRQ